MAKFGFPEQFIQWVKVCISSPKYSFMINGCCYGYIKGQRGIRQGCPMSLYLFVLVMEVFNVLLVTEAAKGRFLLHPRCKNPMITHLSFADDLLVFMKGDLGSARALSHVLDLFAEGTGLKVNRAISSMFSAGLIDEMTHELRDCLGFVCASLPVRYLGVLSFLLSLAIMTVSLLLTKF